LVETYDSSVGMAPSRRPFGVPKSPAAAGRDHLIQFEAWWATPGPVNQRAGSSIGLGEGREQDRS
jgi:hypothetical protein